MAHPLRPRMVRLPPEGLSAELRGAKGEVVNISVGGAFLKVNCKPEVGGDQRLVFVKGDHRLAVDAVVLRVTPDFSAVEPDQRWLVAVQFKAEPSEMRRVISKLLEPTPPANTARRPGAAPPARRS